VAIDESGKHDVDCDLERAQEAVSFDGGGLCLDVTITVPKAKAKRVHLGAIQCGEDGAIMVSGIAAAA
jgi:hypothetical protein